MTYAELQRLVASTTFCGGLRVWGAQLWCRYLEGGPNIEGRVTVGLLLKALPDRDSGLMDGRAGLAEDHLPGSALAAMDTEGALEWVRRVVIRHLVLHELDESILYRGVRVFDPHRPAQDVSGAIRRADEVAEKRAAEERIFRWAVGPTLSGLDVHSIIADELLR